MLVGACIDIFQACKQLLWTSCK